VVTYGQKVRTISEIAGQWQWSITNTIKVINLN